MALPVLTSRGHHIINGTVTVYGRPPGLFGEAVIQDFAAIVEARFSYLIAVNTPASLTFATSQKVGAKVEFTFATKQAVGNQATSTYATRQEISTNLELAFASRTTVYNSVAFTGATRQEVGTKVEFTFGTAQNVGVLHQVAAGMKLELWNATASTSVVRVEVSNSVQTSFATRLEVGVVPAATCAIRLEVSSPLQQTLSAKLSVFNAAEQRAALRLEVNRPVASQASTGLSIFNSTYQTLASRQVIYTRVTYTTATQQRILAVSPYTASYAVKLTLVTPLVSQFAVEVETAPTGRGEGTLEYVVIPPDTGACVDVTAGGCLTIERLPGQVKATYSGPDGPVELVASYSWQAGQELPVAFRWARTGCALFVAGIKQAESSAPLLTGERLASIETGRAQYRNIRVSIRPREDWEIEQAAKAKLWPEDPDTICLAPTPDSAKTQLLTPTVFTLGTLLRADPYAGLDYCLYEGETGWLRPGYDDSYWDEPIVTYIYGAYDVYIWAPAGNGSAATGTAYIRRIFYLHPDDELGSWILRVKVKYASFKAWVNGTLALEGFQTDLEYRYDGPKTVLRHGYNVLAIQAEATGQGKPGVWYWLIPPTNHQLFSGTSGYWEDETERVLGYRNPLWSSWKPLDGLVVTVPADRALRLRASTPRVLRVLNWKDEEEAIARVNLTPVGRK